MWKGHSASQGVLVLLFMAISLPENEGQRKSRRQIQSCNIASDSRETTTDVQKHSFLEEGWEDPLL